MALFLVQHGLSLKKDEDPQKGLSQKGRKETDKIAEVAKFYNIPVAKICHSGKIRALQTARVFREKLEVKEPLQIIKNINPLDDVALFADMADAGSNIMIVGHLPYMEKLTAYLTCGDAQKRLLKFQNSGVVCLDCEDGAWFIKWTLNPNIS